jgi:hypothetical protein
MFLRELVKDGLKSIVRRLLSDYPDNQQFLNGQVSQQLLSLQYKQLALQKESLPKFNETGFRVYSQNDEDGLLLYIFSLIGSTNKVCVDIAYPTPLGANTTNLICNWGWTGLLIDGSEANAKKCRTFFARHQDTVIYPPTVKSAWVTAENINNLIQESGISGEIDLFSLDVDGVDYWLWKSLTAVQPRVVVCEFANYWGTKRAVTVPYDPQFNRFHGSPDFMGASLPAFVKLAKEKGYRLVGCNRYGFNAFFVKNGVGDELLPEVTPEECLHHPQVQQGLRNRLPGVQDQAWVEV